MLRGKVHENITVRLGLRLKSVQLSNIFSGMSFPNHK